MIMTRLHLYRLSVSALLVLLLGIALATLTPAATALPGDAKPLAQQSLQDEEKELTAEEQRELRRKIAEERRVVGLLRSGLSSGCARVSHRSAVVSIPPQKASASSMTTIFW